MFLVHGARETLAITQQIPADIQSRVTDLCACGNFIQNRAQGRTSNAVNCQDVHFFIARFTCNLVSRHCAELQELSLDQVHKRQHCWGRQSYELI
jgi:hypothetical protein